MKFKLVIVLMLSLGFSAFSQTFPSGTNAIHKDSSIIVSWAVSAVIERGYINIADTSFTYTEGGITSNKAWSGSAQNAIDIADGSFVSLGDAGSAVLQFDKPIFNGPGPDFVIFENAIFSPPIQFETAFIELAFVEVSSNGIDFERFPSVSNCQFTNQIGTFEATNWNQFENLAGLYPVFYGVPFNLDDIDGNIVDKNNITHIRIIDIVGNIDPNFASYDSQNNIINNAWPTPFATCGFDLDAVGIIHSVQNLDTRITDNFSVYPNPANKIITIKSSAPSDIKLYDLNGNIIMQFSSTDKLFQIDISKIDNGIYFIVASDNKNIYSQKLVVID